MADIYEPPAARLPESTLRAQKQELEGARKTGAVQHSPDELVMVINRSRQAVYASPKLLSVFGDYGKETFCGKRPGELLGCIHAGADHCGTTEHCRYCGAAAAILRTQEGAAPGMNECVIQTVVDGHPVAYNFRVRTIPLEIGASDYIMLLLDDIGNEKHRAALERIFFHDILNTVTGLQSYVDLMKRHAVSDPGRELATRIGEITSTLVEEIQSQKLLASAENGTLSTNRQFIVSGELIENLLLQYKGHESAANKELGPAGFSESLSFVSDETILRRILGNMVKNALEATGPGGSVTVGCKRTENDVVFEVHNPEVIPHDVRLRIFKRFFSTKGAGRGLGTYSMKLLAEGYLGGNVWFTTGDKEGTSFYVSVPLRQPDGAD